jgi:hypothetical protein
VPLHNAGPRGRCLCASIQLLAFKWRLKLRRLRRLRRLVLLKCKVRRRLRFLLQLVLKVP